MLLLLPSLTSSSSQKRVVEGSVFLTKASETQRFDENFTFVIPDINLAQLEITVWYPD